MTGELNGVDEEAERQAEADALSVEAAQQRKRTAIGFALLAGLAALAWSTMEAGRMRTLVLVVLASFALRLLLFTGRSRYHGEGRSGA